MFRKIEVREADFQPAAVGSDETKAVFNIRAGERVVFASVKPLIAAAASTQSTISLGDGSGVAGFITAYDTESAAVGTLIDGGTATYFASSGGKLYLAADTIDATYDQTTPGATNPKCKFKIGVIREWD